MPSRVDHDARRREVAEALWRVLARDGFAGLSLRSVAAELGATTGLVTHYFAGRAELVDHALQLLHARTDESLGDRELAPGADALRARLLAVLPRTEDGAGLSRIWVGFWGLALADGDLAAREAARYERWRTWLRPHVAAAWPGADVETCVDLITAATHGLVVQALFDPARFPPERLERRLDALLSLIGSGDITHA